MTVLGLTLPLVIPSMPRPVEAMGRLLYLSESRIEINCSKPVMKSAPTFLSYPKGSAKYPFTSYCTSPSVPGAMTLRWEGSWNPSEIRQDRPNAVESITITAYEGFLPMREPGGKIFLYWTGRCDKDPWLQPSTCDRFGSYVPPDVRDALTQIDHERFPLTWRSISSTLKQQLVKQYQAANQQASARMSDQQRIQSMMTQPQQSPIVKQSPPTQAMVEQPQQSPVITQSQAGALGRSGIFARGVEDKEGQPSGQEGKDAHTEVVETSDSAVIEEGTPEIAEPVALKLEHPFHATDAKGEAVELKAGAYEIGTIMDLQLGLAQESQATVLLNAKRDRHSFSIHRTIAVVIPGPSDDLHLLYLASDGRRFDTIGFPSGVKPRSIDMVAPLSDKTIQDAIAAASVKPRSLSSPACRPNPAETGPRWIPVPCTVPTEPGQVSNP